MGNNNPFCEIKCSNPNCDNRIFKKSTDDFWRFRVRTLRIDEGGAGVVAICKSCGTEVALPLMLVAREGMGEPIYKGGGSLRVVQIKKT